jgi:hypothetical protein
MAIQIALIGITIDELKNFVEQAVEAALKEHGESLTVNEAPTLLTESEISERLHRSKVTLNQWRKEGVMSVNLCKNKKEVPLQKS